jgi:hypothetical protein
MNIFIKYGSLEAHKVSVPPGATVASIMAHCVEMSGFPEGNQKLIFKGKTLSDPEASLDSYGLKDNSKVLLIGSDGPVKVEPPPSVFAAPVPFLDYHGRAPRLLKDEYMTADPHSTVIKKGPPHGAMEGANYQIDTLPSEPFIVRDAVGDEATLSFRTDDLYIDSGSNQHRIFYHELSSFGIQPVPGYEQKYLAVGFLMKGKKVWVYFVPKQYRGVIEKILQERRT